MTEFMRKKTVGFYITLVAAVLTLAGLIFYLGYRSSIKSAACFVAASIAVEVLLIVLSAVKGNKGIFNLASTLCAVLLAAGIMISLPNQINGFAYLIAGLYTFDDVRNSAFFLIPAVIALVLYIISSFMDLGKE